MSIYDTLRSQILNLDPASAGLRASDELLDVWGVVLETGIPQGSYTLVALADGTTSLYFSSGGGVIGAGDHEQVAAATRRLVEAAQGEVGAFPASVEQELPADGRTVIRLLTYGGPRLIEAAEKDLGEGRHPQSALFYKAQDVITELRLISDG